MRFRATKERGGTVRRCWTWVALSLLALFVISMVVTTILSVANGSFQQEPAGFLVLLVGVSAFMVVEALIVAHRPGNAIGWIFTAIGLPAATWAPAGNTSSMPTGPGPGRCRAPSWWPGPCSAGRGI